MGRPSIYLFHTIEIGESNSYRNSHRFPSLRSSLSIYAKKSGKAFQTRTENGILWVTRTA